MNGVWHRTQVPLVWGLTEFSSPVPVLLLSVKTHHFGRRKTGDSKERVSRMIGEGRFRGEKRRGNKVGRG